MKVLHLLVSCSVGGIEVLCREIEKKSVDMQNIFCCIYSGGIIADEMINNNADVRILNYGNKDIFKIIKYLSYLCKNEGIDAVIVHHEAPISYIALSVLKSKFPNIKAIVYAHANIKDMLRENIKKGLFIRKQIFLHCYKKCDKVIAISNSVKNSLLERYGTKYEDKIKVVYNGVDLDKFQNNSKQKSSYTTNIVYVGRLFKAKGVDLLIKSLAKIPKDRDFVCNIIGDGEERENLESLIQKYDLKDKVVLRGAQNNVPDWLRESDIFVHPATWEEGFGITIVEAMAAGLVCIAFNRGALPEIINSGENGFLIDEVDENKLSQQILYCIDNINNQNLIDIKENAVTSSKRFSLDNMVEALEREIKTN